MVTQVVFPSAGGGPLLADAALIVAFATAITLTRLAFAAASRSGLLRARLVLVRPEGAAAGGAGPAFFDVAASLSPDAVTPERVRALRASIVVAEDRRLVPAAVREQLGAARIPLLDRAEFVERATGRVDFATLPADWLAGAKGASEGRAEAFLRRAIDLALGVTLLVATFPLLVLAAIAIKLDSPGPVFYRQERVGQGGRTYTLFKFRSMRQDAEAGGKPVWATQQDARVTRVGRFLRLTRIDEIPQVFNVLKGDMAFVGPRPERPGFVGKLAAVIPHYDDRHTVKPGITGWAQVNYPYGASVEDARQKLAYDLYYVRRRSLFLDLLIIMATVRVVLFQEGSR
jgi:exopolysaccharide biosynthesis polyprenyl glycosylphosphotransferase